MRSEPLVFRIVLTRRQLCAGAAAALMLVLAPSLESQTTPRRTVSITTYLPAPVGAFSELAVTGATNIFLARDGNRVGVGDTGAVGPRSELTVVGRALFGANGPLWGDEYNYALQTMNVPGNFYMSGLSMAVRGGGARWVVYPETNAGKETLWFWSTQGNVFGITGEGSLRACRWTSGGPGSCSANEILLFSGTGSDDNAKISCNGDGAETCSPVGNAHLCCNLRFF